jgi:hypothetical protein
MIASDLQSQVSDPTFVFICCAFVPDNQALKMDGDLLLGGLFPIHSNLQGKKCLNIQEQDGIQALEAMKYSIKSVNEDSGLLPGIELGMVGVDTCESETVTLDVLRFPPPIKLTATI